MVKRSYWSGGLLWHADCQNVHCFWTGSFEWNMTEYQVTFTVLSWICYMYYWVFLAFCSCSSGYLLKWLLFKDQFPIQPSPHNSRLSYQKAILQSTSSYCMTLEAHQVTIQAVLKHSNFLLWWFKCQYQLQQSKWSKQSVYAIGISISHTPIIYSAIWRGVSI